MKEKIMKQEKGITLIALVITIIVLLILAGVAISMLSGENGILNKASEAKENTEKASFIEQVKVAVMGAMTNEDVEIKEDELEADLEILGIEKENIISYGNGEYLVIKGTDKVLISKNGSVESGEGIKDIDIELQKYFNDKELPYKCRYGYITGFDYYNQEKVADFEKNLPEGYKVNFWYDIGEKQNRDTPIKEQEKSSMNVATGMSVQDKNNQTVARTIIYGDFTCDGEICDDDAQCIAMYGGFLEYNIIYTWDNGEIAEWQRLATDLNCDGTVDITDAEWTLFVSAGLQRKIELDEDVQKNAIKLPMEKYHKRMYKELQEYIAKLDKTTGYTFEYNDETDTYKLKGVKPNTTVEDLINVLPNSDKLSIGKKNAGQIWEEDKIEMVETGYYLKLRLQSQYFSDIDVAFAVIELE